MGYSNRYSGAISISPPLTAAEIRDVRGGKLARITDVKLRTVDDVEDTPTGQVITTMGTAIVPLSMEYSGSYIVKDVQAIIDYFPGREFGGFIEVHWDPGFENPVPQRYVVRDGKVVTVKPRLVWPGEDAAHGGAGATR